MNSKLILCLIFVFLVASLLAVSEYAHKQKMRANRQENNVYVLTEELSQRVILDSLNVVSKRDMELKASEFEKLFKQEAVKVKALDIRLKNLQHIAVIETVTTDTIRVPIIVKDSVKKFEFNDNYLYLSGKIISDSVNIDYNFRAEINLVQHRVPKRFLGFLWRTKKSKCSKVEAYSTNPKTKIVGITSIKIE